MLYHVFDGLTHVTSEAVGPATSCEGNIFTGFQNWDNHCFSLSNCFQVLCTYTIVQRQQKLIACRWKVTQHLVMDTVGNKGYTATVL
jgi:hypothetical protein